MKRIKSILLLCLCLALCAGVLSACQSSEERMEELAGTWTMRSDDTVEQAQDLLENMEFYEEEMALVDLTGLDDVLLVEFDVEGNYLFGWDIPGIKQCLEEFFDGAFAAMYAGRTTLNEVYGMDFTSYSEEEFRQFYAEIYSCQNYEEMIDMMVEYAYDYDFLAEPLETGTYTIKGISLLLTITGESEAESVGYKVEGDTLTLTFADEVLVLNRTN